MSDKLPAGWTTAPLGTLTRPNRPRVNPQDHRHLPFVGMEQVEAHTRRLLGTLPASDFKSSAFHFQPGDVLYGRLRPYLNKVLLANFEGLCSSEFIVLPPNGVLEPSYLAYYLSTNEFVNFANRLNQGDRPRVNFDQLAEHNIPFPPLAEQQRIVAKLDVLLSKIDGCKDRLAKIPIILKRFRQSVLAAACSGRLTADWRHQHPTLEDTAVQRNHPDLPEIPHGWRWIRLPEAGEMNRGRSRHRPRNEPSLFGGPYPFIQTGDIAQSGGRITTHKQTYNEVGLAQSRIWPAGTICITIAANIAESALLTYPACFPDSVVGLIANPEIALAEYIEFFIRVAKADLAAFAPATAQKNINIAILNEVQVPLPPVPEQREIVRRVENLFALADRIQARYTSATAYIGQLIPGLLMKAFRGELVPIEADVASMMGCDFESAEELLKRIRMGENVRNELKTGKCRSNRSKYRSGIKKRQYARSKAGHF